jgi:hypothetical protein
MNKNEFKNDKEQALSIIANALMEYKGTWNEHQLIQKALQLIVAMLEEYEKKQEEVAKIQNFDNS